MLNDGIVAAGAEVAFAIGTILQTRALLEPAARRCVDMQREIDVPIRFEPRILRKAETESAALLTITGAVIVGTVAGMIDGIHGLVAAVLGAGVGMIAGLMWSRRALASFLVRTCDAIGAELKPLTDEQRARQS